MAFCLHRHQAACSYAGWYSRTTDPETGETKIRVGSSWFPIVTLTRDDSNMINGGKEDGEEFRSGDGSQSGDGPQGGLESLQVGPFGSILNLENGENGPDIDVLGWGR
eukprot:971805-Pelagomonas_calceolata.AAC.1